MITTRNNAKRCRKWRMALNKTTADLLADIIAWIDQEAIGLAVPTEIACRRWRDGSPERQRRWRSLSDGQRLALYDILSERRDPRPADFQPRPKA